MNEERYRFAGTWRLLYQTTIHPDGSTSATRGERPLGLIMYDLNGTMSVHLVRRERITGGNLNALETALDDYIGYFGAYTIDAAAGTVTHHVLACSYPGWSGTEQVRRYQFSDDETRLTLSAPSEDGGQRIVEWEKVG